MDMRKSFGLELAVIVVSVLLAVGAESWWQDRQDAERANDYVEAVRLDMAAFLPVLDSAIAFQQDQFRAATDLVELLLADSPISDTLRISLVNRARVPIPMGTLDGLIQTGDVNHIRDGRLRAAIVRARSELEDIQARLRRDEDMSQTRLEEVLREGARMRLARGANAVQDFRPPTVMSARGNELIFGFYSLHRIRSRDREWVFSQLRSVVENLLDAIEHPRSSGSGAA